MTHQRIATVFGGTRIGNREPFTTDADLEAVLSILTKHSVTSIDSAQSYGSSEATIGKIQAGDRFTIDTKWSPPSFDTPTVAWATRNNIISSAENSIQKLGVKQAGTFYLHRPDPLTPISETLSAVNEIYQRGLFRRLGLSGFPVSEIEAVYKHCDEHDYPLPTVYQGSCNPLSRSKETTLLPTLRRLGISFYAYGPSAGGFLGKTVTQVKEMVSNTAPVSATCRPYISDPKYLGALSRWNEAAETEGVSAAELAYRWIAHHSPMTSKNGDALVIGVSSAEQLEETLSGIDKGPLSEQACTMIHDIWESVKD